MLAGMKRLLPLALAALVLATCSGTRLSTSGTTPPGAAVSIEVLGTAPRVEIANEGPGALRVELDSTNDAEDAVRVIGKGTTSFSALGPLRLRIGPDGDAEATWRMDAFSATGMRTTLLVAPGR